MTKEQILEILKNNGEEITEEELAKKLSDSFSDNITTIIGKKTTKAQEKAIKNLLGELNFDDVETLKEALKNNTKTSGDDANAALLARLEKIEKESNEYKASVEKEKTQAQLRTEAIKLGVNEANVDKFLKLVDLDNLEENTLANQLEKDLPMFKDKENFGTEGAADPSDPKGASFEDDVLAAWDTK